MIVAVLLIIAAVLGAFARRDWRLRVAASQSIPETAGQAPPSASAGSPDSSRLVPGPRSEATARWSLFCYSRSWRLMRLLRLPASTGSGQRGQITTRCLVVRTSTAALPRLTHQVRGPRGRDQPRSALLVRVRPARPGSRRPAARCTRSVRPRPRHRADEDVRLLLAQRVELGWRRRIRRGVCRRVPGIIGSLPAELAGEAHDLAVLRIDPRGGLGGGDVTLLQPVQHRVQPDFPGRCSRIPYMIACSSASISVWSPSQSWPCIGP